MSVRLDGDVVRLEGECRVEEAEELVVLLQAAPGRVVDLDDCQGMHAAVAQVLLGFRAATKGRPADPYLSRFVADNFARMGDGAKT